MMLVSAFVEGVHLHKQGVGHENEDMRGQSANGYELLRQLTFEYSLRTRAEVLSLRSLFASRSYVLSAAEMKENRVALFSSYYRATCHGWIPIHHSSNFTHLVKSTKQLLGVFAAIHMYIWA